MGVDRMVDLQTKEQKLVNLQLVDDMDQASQLHQVRESLCLVFHSLLQQNHGNISAWAIAGSRSGEGASIISLISALAISMDHSNSVLLVDGNLRNPELHRYFGVEQNAGLVELVEQELTLTDVLYKEKKHGFHFLPAGRSVNSPTSFFSSENFSVVLAELKKNFQFIIFDCTPVLDAPETSILASGLNGLIMVVQSETSRCEVVKMAKQRLIDAKVNIVGVILNKQKYYIPDFLYKKL